MRIRIRSPVNVTLYDRETLAQSNLSGKGRHKKKQLDPLVVYGIYCHLKYLYNIRYPGVLVH
jgi:hypothetical protein